MKIFHPPFILAALICLLPAVSHAGIGIGIGDGIGNMGFGLGGPHEIVKISPAVRTTLRNYLAAEYKHECTAKTKTAQKKLPENCQLTKPLYEGSAIAFNDSEPLPSDVTRQLGFIAPGTEYVQAGYVVYLISLPRRIILDSVAVHEPDHTSNIQW